MEGFQQVFLKIVQNMVTLLYTFYKVPLRTNMLKGRASSLYYLRFHSPSPYNSVLSISIRQGQLKCTTSTGKCKIERTIFWYKQVRTVQRKSQIGCRKHENTKTRKVLQIQVCPPFPFSSPLHLSPSFSLGDPKVHKIRVEVRNTSRWTPYRQMVTLRSGIFP